MIVSKYLVFSGSTAPAVEPLSEYKQQNQTHIIKKKSINNQSLIVSSVAGATQVVNIRSNQI